ncbi:DNA damage-induced apoptosis suppressor protein [Tachyglossus aculeatus]|uniref:DNA damage-induced apoptosis suppressor protein n=1 Tax=Tachyglossus aculeatus TaxID=9261 RepID=UPI0018F65977|nr:DNA damage-induced apoptosis suppressor protein [Tachyglossus aculeatus]
MSGRRQFLLASVTAVQNSRFVYPSCQNCFSRIILGSARFHCPRCGCQGETENASYRYKLALRVAGENELFIITVFGSCLNPFFGLPARLLQRYVQDSKPLPGTPDNDAVWDLLIQAVHTCFVGRSFIFGVTNFGNRRGHTTGRSGLWQSWPSRRDRRGELVACQISLPNPAVPGSTVIGCFDRLLRSARPGDAGWGSQLPESLCPIADGRGSEFGSGCSPGSHRVGDGDRPSGLWRLSLGLTSADTQPSDDGAPAALEPNGSGRDEEREPPGTGAAWPYYHDGSPGRREGEEARRPVDRGFSSRPGRGRIGAVDSWAGCPVSDMVQMLARSGSEVFHGFPSGPAEDRSRPGLPSHSSRGSPQARAWGLSLQDRDSFGSGPSPGLTPSAGGSQREDPTLWDELPFSESLNEFLALVEKEGPPARTGARQCSAGEGRSDPGEPSKKAMVGVPSRRSPPMAESLNPGRESGPPGVDSPPKSITHRRAQSADTSIGGKEDSEGLTPNPYQSILALSPKDWQTPPPPPERSHFPPRGAEAIPNASSRGDITARGPIPFSVPDGQSPTSERGAKEVCLGHPERWIHLPGSRDAGDKENQSCPRNQGNNLPVSRKRARRSRASGSGVGLRAETSAKSQDGVLGTTTCAHLPQNSPLPLEASYDASADLFDASSSGEYPSKSRSVFSPWDRRPLESHSTPNGLLSPFSSSQGHPLHSSARRKVRLSLCQRAGSALGPSPPDSQHSLGETQDFVPYSQSTPIARNPRTLRIYRMKDSFKKFASSRPEVTPKPQNCSTVKPASSNRSDSRKPESPASRHAAVSHLPQPLALGKDPAAELPEVDANDWVPPSTKKLLLRSALHPKMLGSRARGLTLNPFGRKTTPRSEARRCGKATTDGCERRPELDPGRTAAALDVWPTPHKRGDGGTNKTAGGETPRTREVKYGLSLSENWSPVGPEANAAAGIWSPELFTPKTSQTQSMNCLERGPLRPNRR